MAPQVRNYQRIHYEPNVLYFFTARAKLVGNLSDGRVQVLGYTRYKEMICLSGKANPGRRPEKMGLMQSLRSNLSCANVYPGETRDIGMVFCIRDMEIACTSTRVNPIFRESCMLGSWSDQPQRL